MPVVALLAATLLTAAPAVTPPAPPAAPASAPAPAAAAADDRLRILDAMEAELARSAAQLKLADYEVPYYIGFRVVEHRGVEVQARFGAIVQDDDEHRRQAAADVRVGSYAFDSSPDPSDFDLSEGSAFQPAVDAPLETDPLVLRATLWLLADEAYKSALGSYLRKRAKKVTEVEDKPIDSFSRVPPVKSIGAPQSFQADRAAWAALARRASARFQAHGAMLDGSVRLSADHYRVFLVTTEGTRLVKEDVIYSLGLGAVARAPDGMLLDQGTTLYGRTLADLPDEATLTRMVDEAMANLKALAAAPMADPYTGPAILEPEATGVFFHEAVGHRLEGDRQKDENEGRTFKGQVGVAVLPPFLTVRDDPTVPRFEKKSLNGYYLYDDEGVPAKNAILVERGVLRSFLTSRTPVEDAPESNGHGRAQGVQRPIARMGNLIVESQQRVTREKLRQMLIEEARKAGKPYGLIIRDITGGSTNTSNYGYQAFKGMPRMVFRVDAKTGAEQLVRGVEMVGTPLTAVNKIVATSDEMGVFNGFCGAESGYVPVSTVAPATLFREIELQRTQREKERKPLLPPPWGTADNP